MNQLIVTKQNDDGDIIVSARDLYDFLEISERFSKWWERMISYGFVNGIDYTPYQMVHPQNKQVITDFAVRLDMAKEISMIQRTDKGKQARQYFLQVERLWNSPEAIMKRALDYANKKLNDLENQIEQQKPKVLFADSVTASQSTILIGDLAKILKQNGIDIGQNRLFQWLRDNGYLIRQRGTSYNMPTQKSMELGLFEIKETVVTHSSGYTSISKTPKVTGKGQVYFINKFLSLKENNVSTSVQQSYTALR